MVQPENSVQAFRKKCIDFMEGEGYRPKVRDETEESAKIFFKKEGADYWIEFFGNDQTLFKIWCLDRYDKSFLSRTDALELANQVNDELIDCKVIVTDVHPGDAGVCVKFQSQCHIPNSFDYAFIRKMNAIEKAMKWYQFEKTSMWMERTKKQDE